MVVDSSAKARDYMDFETNQIEKMTKEFILSHTKISEEKYEQKYRVEWYMLPDEAKENGICDAIIGKDCGIDEIL